MERLRKPTTVRAIVQSHFYFINDNVFNDLIHLTTKIFSRNLIFLTIIRLVFTEPIHQKPILLFQSPSLLLPLN
jgi:hypothetical protein